MIKRCYCFRYEPSQDRNVRILKEMVEVGGQMACQRNSAESAISLHSKEQKSIPRDCRDSRDTNADPHSTHFLHWLFDRLYKLQCLFDKPYHFDHQSVYVYLFLQKAFSNHSKCIGKLFSYSGAIKGLGDPLRPSCTHKCSLLDQLYGTLGEKESSRISFLR